jgi:hypothetical protein
MFRAGAAAATLEVNYSQRAPKSPILSLKAPCSYMLCCKARKEFLESYKKTNAIARLTAALKAPILVVRL